MERNDALYQAYCAILREELVPATGCTEPIALAYCAAKARHALGRMPDRVRAQVSGNIIKNVKSVTVPNTGGQKGIRAAVAAGIVAGDEGAGLEALGNVTPDQIRDIERFAAETPIEVVPLESGVLLDMIVTVWSGEHEPQPYAHRQHPCGWEHPFQRGWQRGEHRGDRRLCAAHRGGHLRLCGLPGPG